MYYSVLANSLIRNGSVSIEIGGPFRERSILRYSAQIISGHGDFKHCLVWTDPIYASEDSARFAMETIINKIKEEEQYHAS